jgi:hypothetical protein
MANGDANGHRKIESHYFVFLGEKGTNPSNLGRWNFPGHHPI